MKKIFGFAVLAGFVFSATVAFAATVSSWEELQRISSIPIYELNGDGGRQALLTEELILTEGQIAYCGSNAPLTAGTRIPAGNLVYLYLAPAKPAQPVVPTTPTPSSDDQKVEAVEVKTFEELQAISSTPLQDNGDEGRGATLTKPLKVGAGQKVLCGSDTPLAEGTVVPTNSFIYMWLAEEGYGLAPVTTLDELKAKGNLIAEEDGIWCAYSPNELVKLSSSDIRVFNMNDFGNEVEDGILRKDGAYRLFLKESFKKFVPKSDEDLKVLAHPKTSVRTGPVWTPDGGTIRNYYVTLAGDWKVAENCGVLFNSPVKRAAGEIIPAGGEALINVTPIADPDTRGDNGGGNSGNGGGGGCDAAGLGLPALALVALALRKQRR